MVFHFVHLQKTIKSEYPLSPRIIIILLMVFDIPQIVIQQDGLYGKGRSLLVLMMIIFYLCMFPICLIVVQKLSYILVFHQVGDFSLHQDILMFGLTKTF